MSVSSPSGKYEVWDKAWAFLAHGKIWSLEQLASRQEAYKLLSTVISARPR